MAFIDWVAKYKGKGSIRGDLAEDILSDKSFPKADDKEAVFSYVESQLRRQNNIQAFSTFKRMYADYLKTLDDQHD